MCKPRLGVCLVCWSMGGEGGQFKMQYGPSHMGRGGCGSQRPGAIPGGATHCCSAHMTSQREVPERRWQLHENGTALLASVSQAYRKHLGTTGQTGSRHSATTLTTLTPKLARTLSVLGSCRAGHMRRLVDVVCCGPHAFIHPRASHSFPPSPWHSDPCPRSPCGWPQDI